VIRVRRLYIQDVSKAKYADRFFYYILNYFSTDITDKHYMTINPLKWSIMTVITTAYLAIIYLIVFPLIGIPCVAYDSWKMPNTYRDEKYDGCYVENALLIRRLPNQ